MRDRYVVLGTSAFTLACTRGLIDAGADIVCMVTLPRSRLPDNSVDVGAFAAQRGIRCIEAADINERGIIDELSGSAPDYLFSSWPHMIGETALRIPRAFTIGSHPTALPHNRGRHPLHWLITQGIAHTVLTLFRMDSGVDSGPVLLQIPFTIEDTDSIGDAAERMCAAGYDGLRRLCRALEQGLAAETPQDQSRANTWRKKTLHDVTLDLRLPAQALVDIVRSFAPPYPGARLLVAGAALRVHRAAVDETRRASEELERIEPGKVIARSGSRLTVKAGDAIVILDLEGDVPASVRTYIHPPSYYLEAR